MTASSSPSVTQTDNTPIAQMFMENRPTANAPPVEVSMKFHLYF